MEEDIQETLVLNKDIVLDPQEEIAAAKERAAEKERAEAEAAEDSIPDDIEYTLLINEVTDLTIPVPSSETGGGGEAAGEDEADEEETAEPETAETAESAETGDAEDQENEEEASEEAEEGEKEYGLPAGHLEVGELEERIQARRRYNERKRRRFRTRFYVIMTVLIFTAFFMLISLSSIFTVDSIEVRGNNHYTAEEIINMGHAVPGRNLIYHLNRQEIEEYLEQNPYIKNATVSRKLPSTMVIKVTEREERMAFRYDDDYLIMDEDGILLKKTRNEPKTTIVEGMIVNRIKLGEKIGSEDSERLDRIIGLIHSMTAADMYFVRVDMNKDSAVRAYIYETLSVKTDYDTLIENLDNGRLHLVVEKLFSEGIKRGTITFDEDGSASFQPTL